MYNSVVLEEYYQLSLKTTKLLFTYKLCFYISVNRPLAYQIYSGLVFDLFFGLMILCMLLLLFGDEYILFPGKKQTCFFLNGHPVEARYINFSNVCVAEAKPTGHLLGSGYGIPCVSRSFGNL